MLAAGNAYTERLFCLIQPMFAVLVFELPTLSVLNGDGEHNLQNEKMFCGIAFRTHLPCARIYNWLTSERSSVELWSATPAFLDLSNFPSAPMTPL